MSGKFGLQDVTFVIPLRIDSVERLENVVAASGYLAKHFETNVIVCEADRANTGLLAKMVDSEIKTFFVHDTKSSFHRTYYINELVRFATTAFVAVWDADVLVDAGQIRMTVQSLRNGTYDFVYPYDGRFVETGVKYRRLFLNTLDISVLKANTQDMLLPYSNAACGGGFLARREAYVRAGMENERFSSWGPEDGERLKRWRTLKMRIGRVKGEMFHLYHSRGRNSQFKSEAERKKLIAEADRIGGMSKEEMEKEVSAWIRKVNLRKRLLQQQTKQ